MKARIVEQLGETAVLMPGRIAEGSPRMIAPKFG